MKKILLGCVMFIAVNVTSLVYSQIKNNELNPDYIQWLENKNKTYYSNGHTLGEIPPPYKIHAELPEYLRKQLLTKEYLSSTFDLRSSGKVTSVKNQGGCGSCWTFATMASIESRWIVNGKGTYDLSEDNLNTCHTPFVWAPCEGGNTYLSIAYFARGSGPKSESDDPYSDSHTSVDCPSSLNPQGLITSGWFIPTSDPSLIKSVIQTYGALATNMYWTDGSYNSGNYTYYYSGTAGTNHAVTLVGWDDNKVTAGGTGAWIIKNSWGSSWGENGYFYIAYQDSKVNSTVTLFKDYKEYDPNETVSTYSESGWVNDLGLSSNAADVLAKFTATGNVQLTKVGTYTNYPGAVVTIDVYDTFNGSNSLTDLLGSISSQSCTYSGYYTFNFSSPINISNGNDYYIKIRYQTTGYNYPIPVEEAVSGFNNPTFETGKCWVKGTGSTSWISLDGYDWDLCVYSYSNINTAPLSPANLVAADSSDQCITIKWKANTETDFLCYRMYCGTSPNPTTKVDSSTTCLTDTSKTFTGLVNGTRYYFRVTAVDNIGNESGYSNQVNAMPDNRLPVEITSFTGSAKGKAVELAWQTATEVNNYGFEIERSPSPTPSQREGTSQVPASGGFRGAWEVIGFVEGTGNSNIPKSYSFVDVNISGKVLYRLKQIDNDGQFEYHGAVEVMAQMPQKFALMQNYPNPFNPTTAISYQLSANSFVTLKVYDMLGKEIATLVNGMQEAGDQQATFTANNFPSGLYFYTLRAGSFVETKKMLLIK